MIGKTQIVFLVGTSEICTVPSLPDVAMNLPSGENPTPRHATKCLPTGPMHLRLATSHKMAVPALKSATARTVPSGEKHASSVQSACCRTLLDLCVDTSQIF